MLVKSYKIINSHVYKRYKTPNYPNMICQIYNCSEGSSHNERSIVCMGCNICNYPLEELYGDFGGGWETKFCYIYISNKKKRVA